VGLDTELGLLRRSRAGQQSYRADRSGSEFQRFHGQTSQFDERPAAFQAVAKSISNEPSNHIQHSQHVSGNFQNFEII
jgi:hypothetical protein